MPSGGAGLAPTPIRAGGTPLPSSAGTPRLPSVPKPGKLPTAVRAPRPGTNSSPRERPDHRPRLRTRSASTTTVRPQRLRTPSLPVRFTGANITGYSSAAVGFPTACIGVAISVAWYSDSGHTTKVSNGGAWIRYYPSGIGTAFDCLNPTGAYLYPVISGIAYGY